MRKSFLMLLLAAFAISTALQTEARAEVVVIHHVKHKKHHKKHHHHKKKTA